MTKENKFQKGPLYNQVVKPGDEAQPPICPPHCDYRLDIYSSYIKLLGIEKQCIECGIIRPLYDYRYCGFYDDEHAQVCEHCLRAYTERCTAARVEKMRAYYNTHAANLRAYAKKYRQTPEGKATERRSSHKRHTFLKETEADLTAVQMQYILESQKNKCDDCGKPFTKNRPPTFDHIYPVSKGGDLTSWNMRAICKSCNSKKRAKIRRDKIATWIYLGSQNELAEAIDGKLSCAVHA